MLLIERINNYRQVTGFPKSLFIGGDGRLNGIWVMGNNYQVASSFYGGYPYSYLKRIAGLFPDKQNILHLFSGKIDTDLLTECQQTTFDINPANNPDYIGDAHNLSNIITKKNSI